jgi:hypothetical protein
MPFLQVWEVGGYIMSHLVRAFTQQSNEDVLSIFTRYWVWQKGTTDGRKHLKLMCPGSPNNARLKRNEKGGDAVDFASRYITCDVVSICRTLAVLDACASRSLPRFLSMSLEEADGHADGIRRLAEALDQLTYSESPQVGADAVEEAAARAASAEAVVSARYLGYSIPPGRKRLWCSLRDYLKSPEFNTAFVGGLKEAGFSKADHWRAEYPELKKALHVLELPGDVWNNSTLFRNGLFAGRIEGAGKTWDMPRTIREVYVQMEEDLSGSFYPEIGRAHV